MRPLESRKHLLIAESELNRAQWASDMAALGAGVRGCAERCRPFRVMASSTVVLLVGLAAWIKGTAVKPERKSTWRQMLMDSVGLISTVWVALRTSGPASSDKRS